MNEKEMLERMERLEEKLTCILEMLGDPETVAEIQRRMAAAAGNPANNKRQFSERLGTDAKEPPRRFPG
jgi:hypothetical protein